MNKSDKKGYLQAIEKFNNVNVLIVGDVMMDTYLWGEANRISPEAPVPIVRSNGKEYRLGGAANVALNIKALGGNPIICSVIGDDEAGETLQQLFDDYEIGTEGLIIDKDRPTTNKTRIFSKTQQVVRYDEETTDLINPKTTQQLYQKIEELVTEKGDLLIFQDYDKGVLHQTLNKNVIQCCRKADIPTTADPKQRNFWHYQQTTLFKPNLRELKEGLPQHIDVEDEKKLIEQAQELRSKMEVNILLVTLAARGILTSTQEESRIIPAYTRNVADVAGAGDTVISVASLGLVTDLTPYQIAELANMAAGLVCQEVGVVPIQQEALIKEVHATGHD